MELAVSFSQINWLSVTVAAFAGFLLVGGVWYGPLFGQLWMKEFGFTEASLKDRNMIKIFVLSFLLAFMASFNLAMYIGADAGVFVGMLAGFFAGFGWVAAFLGILYLFEQKSMRAFLVNAGYCVVAMTVIGAVLGAMS